MYLHKRFRLEYRGNCYSASQLRQLLDSLCWRLQKKGLQPGMVLSSTLDQRWLNALLLFALPRMGCVFFPLDSRLPQQRRDQLLAAAQVDMLLEDADFFRELEYSGDRFPEQKQKPGAVCLLLATSGTCGSPQVVEFTVDNLLSSVMATEKYLQVSTRSVWLACLPLFHIGGLSILLRGAYSGAKVVLEENFSREGLKYKLGHLGVTHLSLVPTMLAGLLDRDDEFKPPPSLRIVVLGGAAASEKLVNHGLQRGWPICPSYGMTETTSQVATCFPAPERWIAGVVGKPLPHVEIVIDKEGAVRLRGASVARFARQSDGRRKLLVDAEGWLHTRDAGWLDEDEILHIDGRLDDVLVSGGENIHPQMLEQELAECPGVEEVVISAVADAVWGEKLVALHSGSASGEAVHNWAKQHLQKAFLPKQFFKLENLPRNAMGKLLRAEIKRIAFDLSQSR
jgi:O-succinylbenzoic acid--CoA ligase